MSSEEGMNSRGYLIRNAFYDPPISIKASSLSQYVAPLAVVLLNSPTLGAYESNLLVRMYRGGVHRPPWLVCADGAFHFAQASLSLPLLSSSSPLPSRAPSDNVNVVICGDLDSLDSEASPSSHVTTFAFDRSSEFCTAEGPGGVMTPEARRLLRHLRAADSNAEGTMPSNNPPVGLIRVREQDSTDFDKCAAFVHRMLLPAITANRPTERSEASPLATILVLGATGGRFDHTMANIKTLLDTSTVYQGRPPSGVHWVLHDENNTMMSIAPRATTTFVRNEHHEGRKVGLVPFTSQADGVTTNGLAWEVHSGAGSALPFGFGGYISTSNSFAEKDGGGGEDKCVIDTTQCGDAGLRLLLTVNVRRLNDPLTRSSL